MNSENVSRRTLLKKAGQSAASFAVMQLAGPTRVFAQAGDEVIPWLDQPTPNPAPPAIAGNLLDWEKLEARLTPAHNFFYINHYGYRRV